MSIKIEIPDEDLNGFSAQAQETLKTAIEEFSSELIDETNRLEAGRNASKGAPEVTRGMVIDAKILLKRGLGSPKKGMWPKILQIISAILSLLAGIMYNDTKLQDSAYLLIFILVVTATILAVTISTIKE
ncbi:hypothetical protein [Serratia marcescens]|nr:hypothetical protein [Serratia marcescens]MBK5607530.1 hypothetical protein [Serratia marcescens]OKP48825.1 hypothetical protein A8A12_21655 [Serratia marcescens]